MPELSHTHRDRARRLRDGRPEAEPPLREQALERLRKQRDFRAHLLAYVLVNGFLWLIWAVVLTAADGPSFPWPLFPLAGWGIGLVFHAWDTYGRKTFTAAEIAREEERLRGRAGS
ncbi:MAG TPA: 2TM domain-containing protein [Gaiellaceae bacterium]|nr:2TM domain-containing protein [Gaiellaceae bacterium]